MLVITRHPVPSGGTADFLDRAAAALAALAARPGFVRGTVGQAVDGGGLLTIITEWENVGAYRRALSAYEVKVAAVPLLSTAVDEPSAFEPVLTDGPDGPRRFATDRADDADSGPTGGRP